jgi:hypothetical protein
MFTAVAKITFLPDITNKTRAVNTLFFDYHLRGRRASGRQFYPSLRIIYIFASGENDIINADTEETIYPFYHPCFLFFRNKGSFSPVLYNLG